jgi:hypothetical protein
VQGVFIFRIPQSEIRICCALRALLVLDRIGIPKFPVLLVKEKLLDKPLGER